MQENNIDDQQLSKLERRRLKRDRKKEERAKEKKRVSIKKIFQWVIGVIVMAGIAGAFIFLNRSSLPTTEDLSVMYPDQGRNHISVGVERFEYNSDPPTSGPHYANWITSRTLDNETDDRHLIHNLEHGHIWISYHPERVSKEVASQLEDLAGSWVVVAPRSANETDIALAAWTRLDTFNLEGGEFTPMLKQRVKDFIERYKNKAPEGIPI